MNPNPLPTITNNIIHMGMKNEKGDTMLIGTPVRRKRPLRSLAFASAVVALVYFVWTFSNRTIICTWSAPPKPWRPHTQHIKELVPLEAHIMSKCPDAKICLKEMVLPAMQQVYDKVNFTLSFIGTPTDNDGVACMHGAEECMGNIIELCAAHLYPDPKIYLGFTMCLTREYKDIPQRSLVEDCALEHGIDFSKLNECAGSDDGGFGVGMLRDSVRRSTQAGVTKSCTVRLNEEIYCIRDGGEWTDCPKGPGVNDLVITVEKLYQSSS
jgi:hypothetical protein